MRLLGVGLFGTGSGMTFVGRGCLRNPNTHLQDILDIHKLDGEPAHTRLLRVQGMVGEKSALLLARLSPAMDRSRRAGFWGTAVVVEGLPTPLGGYARSLGSLSSLYESLTGAAFDAETRMLNFEAGDALLSNVSSMNMGHQPFEPNIAGDLLKIDLTADWHQKVSLADVMLILSRHPDFEPAHGRGLLVSDLPQPGADGQIQDDILATWADDILTQQDDQIYNLHENVEGLTQRLNHFESEFNRANTLLNTIGAERDQLDEQVEHLGQRLAVAERDRDELHRQLENERNGGSSYNHGYGREMGAGGGSSHGSLPFRGSRRGGLISTGAAAVLGISIVSAVVLGTVLPKILPWPTESAGSIAPEKEARIEDTERTRIADNSAVQAQADVQEVDQNAETSVLQKVETSPDLEAFVIEQALVFESEDEAVRIIEIQTFLRDRDFTVSKPDGGFGPNTSRIARDFADKALKAWPTGADRLLPATLKTVLENDIRSLNPKTPATDVPSYWLLTQIALSEQFDFPDVRGQAKAIAAARAEEQKLRQQAEGAEKEAREKADNAAWAKALETPSIPAYEAYLTSYPEGLNASTANEYIDQIKDDAAWSRAKTADTIEGYDAYLDNPKHTRHTTTAMNNRNLLIEAAETVTEKQSGEEIDGDNSTTFIAGEETASEETAANTGADNTDKVTGDDGQSDNGDTITTPADEAGETEE